MIGAGSAGLSVAAGAAQMGAKTVLIEDGKMGGDCLNTGCVPSKSLLAAGKAAQRIRQANRFGISVGSIDVDYPAVHRHVHGVIAAIEPHDSQERFEKLGCRVIRARGRFVDRRTVEAGGYRIRARRFVIATGSRAAVPPIDGIDTVPFLTNETIFELTELPSHLLVLGGGPIGCELAQAFRRLGAAVTIVDQVTILPKDDSDAASVVRNALRGDGITLIQSTAIERIAASPSGPELLLSDGRRLVGSHLLIAAGRTVNVDDLGLEAADIEYDRKGIKVDARLRTTNRRIYAAGDVTGGLQFTHLAGYHAGIVLRNALFRLPARTDLNSFPWVTYTDPELAQVGLNEAQARELHGDRMRVIRASFDENDRTLAEGDDVGFLKVMLDHRGHILGATMVGPHAGELIQIWALAMSSKLKIGAVANFIAPYPTLGEINKSAARSFYTPVLFGPWIRRLVHFLGKFG